MTIKYFYKHAKSMNCTRVCNDKEEFRKWLELDKKCGHRIVFTKYGYNCYIDY